MAVLSSPGRTLLSLLCLFLRAFLQLVAGICDQFYIKCQWICHGYGYETQYVFFYGMSYPEIHITEWILMWTAGVGGYLMNLLPSLFMKCAWRSPQPQWEILGTSRGWGISWLVHSSFQKEHYLRMTLFSIDAKFFVDRSVKLLGRRNENFHPFLSTLLNCRKGRLGIFEWAQNRPWRYVFMYPYQTHHWSPCLLDILWWHMLSDSSTV